MRLSKVAACVLAVGSSVALAQSGDRGWEGEAELGVLITSGNTEETNINGRFGLKHEDARWRNLLELRTLYSEADDETTAERYAASAETNLKFNESEFLFLRGAYDDQRFSGYDFQSSVTTGYGNRVWQQGERSFLDLSVGGGYRFNKLEEPDEDGSRDEKEAIARLAAQFDYALSDTSLFRQKIGSEMGLEENNVITISETSLQATVMNNLSMKVAFRVKNVSDAPEGTENTDTETSLSLLYGF